MIIDNLARGAAVISVPIAYSLNLLSLWQLYVVAIVYGFFFMITLAGSPSIVPDLVPKPLLPTANALETLAFTLSGVAGPPIAGFVILRFGAPNVMLIDAISYGVFIFLSGLLGWVTSGLIGKSRMLLGGEVFCL
jgi:MFS family permease